MVGEEVVVRAGGRDGAATVLERRLRRLAQLHAVSAVRDHAIHHGARPVATLDRADDRGVRQSERGHERVGLGGVATRLVRLERPDEDAQLVQRGHALAPLAGMRRPDPGR